MDNLDFDTQYIGVIFGGYNGIMENKMETTIMENQMENKMENDMETGGIFNPLGFRV